MRKDHVVSVRFDEALLAEAVRLAGEDRRSLGNWIRNVVAAEAHRAAQPPGVPGLRAVEWQCDHLSMTSSAGVLGKVTCSCGCEMRPVYESAA
jgi:hypothetical protein